MRTNPLEKYAYLIDQTINKWTVLDLKNDRRHADAICRCECGTIKPVNIRNLINNCTKDCGCGRKKYLSESRTKNLVGMTFGKLKVEELLPDSNKFNRRMYKCKCECGNTIIVPSNSLTTYHTMSCGCLNSYYNYYISKLLDDKKVEYKSEHQVIIDGERYRFDFYLPQYNLFIEYDGSQHYDPRFYIGIYKSQELGIKKFKEQKLRDEIKNKYCSENNINLLRIPYWDSKNIKTIIDGCLQRLNEKGLIKI